MLATKNIFLDTSAIIQENFDYKSPSLRRIEELAVSGSAHIVTTPITNAEVESNIRERVQNFKTAYERFGSNHPIIKNLPQGPALLKLVDYKAMEAHLVRQYHEFLVRTLSEAASLELASVDDVFRSYFDRKPPFGGGKKKTEFPDAFVMSALENWCKKRSEKLYVVTTDPDLVTYCSTSAYFLALGRPSEFIDAFLRQDAAMQVVEQTTREHEDQLARAVETEFGQLGFFLDDQEGDVNDVTVTKVSIEGIDLLEVSDRVATFEIFVRVNFLADISFDDMDTAIWDSEDKVAIPLHRIDTEVERELEVAVTVQVTLDQQGEFESVSNVAFPKQDIAITAVERDW